MTMKGKLNIFLLKTLLYALPVCIGFEIIFRLGFYPLITNSILFDYKMIQVQKQHREAIRIMAIGSSCGLHDLNSPVMVRNFGPSYYNFSSWGLQLSDMRQLLPQLVDRYRPEYLILCSSPWDFRIPPNETYRNYTSMPPFIRDHFPEFFYFKQFSSIHQLVFRKWESYLPPIDRWGGTPLTVPKERIHRDEWDKYFLFPTMSTPGGYNDLDTLSAWLQDRKIPLVFAEMPVNLAFDNAPEARLLLAEHIRKCRSIVTAHRGIFLNYHDPASFPDSLFFDQTHLQAAGGEIMTNKLAADLKGMIK
jgi:hypothetical protein